MQHCHSLEHLRYCFLSVSSFWLKVPQKFFTGLALASVAQLAVASFHIQEGCRFDPQSGHMQGGDQCFSLTCLSLPLPPSVSKSNEKMSLGEISLFLIVYRFGCFLYQQYMVRFGIR